MGKTANYSLAFLKMGNVAGDGTMGTALTQFDDPKRDTTVLTMADGTKQDFLAEISDSPYYSVNTPGAVTLATDLYAKSATQLQKIFGGTIVAGAAGYAASLGAITPGSAYTNGQYNNVTLNNGVIVNITVAGGVVTNVVLVSGGSGNSVGGSLTTSNANIGGTGTGFAVAVATITTAPAKWSAPNTQITLEQSIELTHKNGSKISLVRVSLNATFEWNFKRSDLPLIHLKGTVLDPIDPVTGSSLGIAPYFYTEQPS